MNMAPQKTSPSKCLRFLFQFYPLILVLLLPLIFLSSVSAFRHQIPRLTPHKETFIRRNSYKNLSAFTLSEYLRTYYYTQTVDHFNYLPKSYTTFQQRYMIDFKYWGGARSNSPIFVCLGAEEVLEYDLQIGFLRANAPHFKALLVYIEHRYYGESVPFGTMEEAMNDENVRGYFNSAQALADYAELLIHIKEKFSAQNSPIIVIGGSYGGMLASWFRLKYPHIALGALASSAPVLYFDNITPENSYYSIVTKDFKEASESCYETILKSWSEIDKVASSPYGLAFLSRKIRSCRPFNTPHQLKRYLELIYVEAAQYNAPPEYPVSAICRGIDGAPAGTDILSRIVAGVKSYINSPCYNINEYDYESEPSIGWSWQTCSEMVMPFGRSIEDNDTMFPPLPFNLDQFIQNCESQYGVPPRPHWITTYYGGHDIKKILGKFGSNIIFSNGLKDPYSSGGVLEDISDSVVAITTANGSHCLDLEPPRQSDPRWLVEQRNKEIEIIDGWIAKYHAGLS